VTITGPGRLLPIEVEWRPRSTTLPPAAALAIGALSCERLLGRLQRYDDAHLARLDGVCSPDVVLIAGAEADLPWVEGLRYLGRDRAAPALLVPTALEPSVPASLLERAIVARAVADERYARARRWAIWPSPAVLVPLSEARRLSRRALGTWPLRAASSVERS
jgi:hypothetical protein